MLFLTATIWGILSARLPQGLAHRYTAAVSTLSGELRVSRLIISATGCKPLQPPGKLFRINSMQTFCVKHKVKTNYCAVDQKTSFFRAHLKHQHDKKRRGSVAS